MPGSTSHSSGTSRSRPLGLVIGIVVMITTTTTSRAALTIDLRLADQSSFVGQKFLLTTHDIFTRRIPIDVYAIVTGRDPAQREGLTSLQGAFISSSQYCGPSVSGRILPAGDLDVLTEQTVLPAVAPFNGPGASRGASKELSASAWPAGGADQLTDLGDHPHRADLGELVVFRADPIRFGPQGSDYAEFRIGRIELDLDEYVGMGVTSINWYFRRQPNGQSVGEAAIFREDGVTKFGTDSGLSVGQPITISALTPCPEPAGAGVLLVAALVVARRSRRGRLRPAP